MKITKFFPILIFLLFIYNQLDAQVTQEWATRYNGPGNSVDHPNAMTLDASGNIYVTGRSISGTGDYDILTIKYNSSGDSVWVRRYNGPAGKADFGYSIAVDGNNNIYVTGISNAANNAPDIVTIKYNSSGIQQWASLYNGPANSYDEGWDVALDNLGFVYVAGHSVGSALNYDYLTIKYDPNTGSSIWTQRLSDSSAGNVYMAIDASNNLYVTGYAAGDYLTVKYNSSGVQQWIKRYGLPGNNNDIPHSIAVDGSANVYVTGSSSIDTGQNYDYATIKYNSSGIQQWVQRYNGTADYHDNANSIAVDNSGNVYVTGQSLETGTTNSSCTTIKYSSSGIQQWVQSYSGPNGINATQNTSNSIALDASGNVYVAGECAQLNSGYDYVTIKYSPAGIQQWIKFYNYSSIYDYAGILLVDPNNNVYVTGSSFGTGSSYDFATVKYSQMTGITNISTETPHAFSLSQNYPNPFNPVTNIEFSIPQSGLVKLIVYDILGKQVQTLVNRSLNSGSYKVNFDGSNLTSGVYFYAIESNDFNEIRKMFLLK